MQRVRGKELEVYIVLMSVVDVFRLTVEMSGVVCDTRVYEIVITPSSISS